MLDSVRPPMLTEARLTRCMTILMLANIRINFIWSKRGGMGCVPGDSDVFSCVFSCMERVEQLVAFDLAQSGLQLLC